MKTLKRKYTMMCAALGLALLAASPAAALRGNRAPVDALDEVSYDGTFITVIYTVDSRCKAPDHKTIVEFESEKTASKAKKAVVALTARVYDSAPEQDCEGRLAAVVVKSTLDFSKLVEGELSGLRDKDYSIDPDYIVNLPAVRPPLPDDGHSRKPPAESGDASGSVVKQAAPVTKVKVVNVNYVPAWKCLLNKNDGSSRDGFTGIGPTLDEARRNSVSQCLSTGNPSCNAFSADPAHTACEAGLTTQESVAEYDSDKLPEGARTESWNCILRKSDGSRKDGFTGAAATEEEARAQAASGCQRTNNPQCDAYSTDDAHTKCEPRVVVEGPKPQAVYKCTLWKNDGSRKDGFGGSGPTMQDAQRDAASGCQRTNNPNCLAYATDPAHTQCTADFVYPDK